MNRTTNDLAATLLEQPNRLRIVQHLESLPGDHFRSLVRALRLSRGTVRYHLLLLTRAGIVRSERIGGKSRYFLASRETAPLMNDIYKRYWRQADLRARVWAVVLRLPDPRPSTVAAELGLSRQLAAYHLKQLAHEGRVVPLGGSYLPVDARRTLRVEERPEEPQVTLRDAFRIGAAARCLGTSRVAVPPAMDLWPASSGLDRGLSRVSPARAAAVT